MIRLVRRHVQLVSLVVFIPLCATLLIAGKFHILVGILLLVIVSSVVVGRAFCSWLCPLGTLYELSRLDFPYQRLRPLCRIGCPLSLVIGFMNRFSVLKVEKDHEKCKQCGVCDASCPVGLPDRDIGYKDFSRNPSKRYACIRCLNCVASCPNDALKFRSVKLPHS